VRSAASPCRIFDVEGERKAADQRKTSMHELAAAFEAAVGGIVGTVSTASTELEAAAASQKRTTDVLQKPDNSKSYRHLPARRPHSPAI
jgi:hypothetical protein